jgi:hypothetical protein
LSEKNELLCPHCFNKNDEYVDFCSKCGCPLGNYVTLDPLKRIASLGWAYRRAVSGPISKIVLWAMWLIFGTYLFNSLWGLISSLYNPEPFIFPIVSWIAMIICIVILYKVTKNYHKYKKEGK